MVGEDVLINRCRPHRPAWPSPSPGIAAPAKIVITDINGRRLELAKKFGPTRTVNTAKENLTDVWHKELGNDRGLRFGLEMSGSAIALKPE